MSRLIPLIIVGFAIISCKTNSAVQEVLFTELIEQAKQTNLESKQLVTGCYFLSREENEFARILDKSVDGIYLNPEPIFIKANIRKVYLFGTNSKGEGDPRLGIELDKAATKAWYEATSKAVGDRIAIVIDDRLISAPVVNEPIPSGKLMISGVYSEQELIEMQLLLK